MLRLGQPLPPVLDGRQLAVVDVEGNGQQPPEIVEIAVLPLSGGVRVAAGDVRSWLVRPQQPIMPIARRLHGISNEDLAGRPWWPLVAPDVVEALGERILVAHNASVEHHILVRHLPGWVPPAVLDTMRLAKALWPGLASYRLDRLVAHAGLTQPPVEPGRHRHRAGFDTVLTAELFLALVDVAVGTEGLDWNEIVAVGCYRAPADSSRAPRGADGTEGLW